MPAPEVRLTIPSMSLGADSRGQYASLVLNDNQEPPKVVADVEATNKTWHLIDVTTLSVDSGLTLHVAVYYSMAWKDDE